MTEPLSVLIHKYADLVDAGHADTDLDTTCVVDLVATLDAVAKEEPVDKRTAENIVWRYWQERGPCNTSRDRAIEVIENI